MLSPSKGKRENQVDILRGIALFCMIAANMVPCLLITPHPIVERLIGSLAAPLFIILAGMMASLSRHKPTHRFKHFLVRGSLLILIGCILDALVYQSYPLTSMDVLYLIGLSLIISYPLLYMETWHRVGLVLLIFLITPILQKFYGYPETPSADDLTMSWYNLSEIVKATTRSWLIEGYFPLFPWFGYFLVGTVISNLRWTPQTTHYFNNRHFLLFSACLLAGGIIVWILNPGPLYTRFGYTELFYPATWGFIATSLGIIFTLFYLIDRYPHQLFYWPLLIYGKSSLFIYIMHSVLIAYILERLFPPQPLSVYLGLYIALCSILLSLAWLLDKYRPRLRNTPFLVRFVLGA